MGAAVGLPAMRTASIAVLLLLGPVSGCFDRADPLPPAMDGVVGLEPFASGFEQPLQMVGFPDGSGRRAVVEQGGNVWILQDGARLDDPFLDVTDLVSTGTEQGLLSIAFHPGFQENRVVLVSYTDAAGDTMIARYRVDAANPDRLDPATAEAILTVDQPFANHNGGLVLWGPDGHLYVGLGDGGAGADPFGHAQNTATLLGSILRIDVGATGPYTAPRDNPFVGEPPAEEEIWSYGLRNPWRFSFDRKTGDLWMADVGQGAWEEVDVEPTGGPGGANYGWNAWEGNHQFTTGVTVEDAVFPVAEYGHDGGHCSVTGGFVYRGSDVPPLAGKYVFGDYCSGRIWTLERIRAGWNADSFRTEVLMDSGMRISAFAEDLDGEMYVIDHGGNVARFVVG